METKFTAAPWSTEHRQNSDRMYSTEVFDSEGETICVCSWFKIYEGNNGVISTNRQDNANLISSAPAMYEMLERQKQGLWNLIDLDIIKENYKNDAKDLINDIDNLLAKARGES